MFTSMPSFPLKLVFITVLVAVVTASFAYTRHLIGQIQDKEQSSMELWASAMEYNSRSHYQDTRDRLLDAVEEMEQHGALDADARSRWGSLLRRAESDLGSASLDFVVSELIIEDRFDIPSLLVDENGEILQYRNVDEDRLDVSLVEKYAQINEPISITVGDGDHRREQKIYYGESGLIRSLRYFPYIQFGLLALLLGLGYVSLISIKRSEESHLWVGMAREAAHQLGTPLSSLYGWVTLLREKISDGRTQKIVDEIVNDVNRMQGVADRFSKIGSRPELMPQPVKPLLDQVVDYVESRIPRFSKNIKVQRDYNIGVTVLVNAELISWAVENLMKNAMDAIDRNQDNGRIIVEASLHHDMVCIDITDTGKGIGRNQMKTIFKPGVSTRKRGWGLGLSLTRRIVEDYHRGRVYVYRSVPGEKTTFRMEVPVHKDSKVEVSTESDGKPSKPSQAGSEGSVRNVSGQGQHSGNKQ